jgi:hypothetical protein
MADADAGDELRTTEHEADATSARHRAPWAEDDYLELVQCLCDGLSDAETAQRLGRTINALRARAQIMLPSGYHRLTALEELRTRLRSDADYDWRTPVMATAQANGWHFWTRADEDVLARGWVASTPMTELTARLGVPETAIVRQLLGLRLAMSIDEITSRIGVMPGGDIALRQALAAGKAEARVWCVVVIARSAAAHISIHANQADAETARDKAIDRIPAGRPAHWWIAERVPGDRNNGTISTGRTTRERPAGRATPAQRKWARGPQP